MYINHKDKGIGFNSINNKKKGNKVSKRIYNHLPKNQTDIDIYKKYNINCNINIVIDLVNKKEVNFEIKDGNNKDSVLNQM